MFVTKVCKICVLWLVNGIMIVDTKSNRSNIFSKLFLTCNYVYSWPAHPMYTPRCSYYMCMHLSTILYSDVHTSLLVLYLYALEHYSVCTWALFCIQMYTPRCSYYMCMHLRTILYSDVHTSWLALYVYALEHYSVFRCTHLVARTICACTWALFCIQMY